MPDTRYAVYYAPPAGSALAAFGASWLGWDPDVGMEVDHPDVDVDVARLTHTPRVYGFHGTLKPPFRLAPGRSLDELQAAIAEVGATTAPFDAPPLELRRIGRFVALVPREASEPLAALAATCVQMLDAYRAPPTPEETAKRRKAGLSGRQEALLAAWGYPYVLEEFRFHMTLTGPLDEEDMAAALACLEPRAAPFANAPMPVREICLFHQEDGAPFRILHRYPLTG